MEERRKMTLGDKRSVITIIVGIITILAFVIGIIISITAWKYTTDISLSDIQEKNTTQDTRLDKLEEAVQNSNVSLAEINANLEFIKKALERLEAKK